MQWLAALLLQLVKNAWHVREEIKKETYLCLPVSDLHYVHTFSFSGPLQPDLCLFHPHFGLPFPVFKLILVFINTVLVLHSFVACGFTGLAFVLKELFLARFFQYLIVFVCFCCIYLYCIM